MTTSEKIQQQLEHLPESLQEKVLNFIESLADEEENADWQDVSLASAMRGMEGEDAPVYSDDDVKEHF